MTDEQIKQYHKQIDENIVKYGYHSTFVFADNTPSFCYSTGIYKNFGIPEIFISSLPQNLSHELIQNYVNKFKNMNGVPLDIKIDDLTDRFPVYLIEVPIDKLTGHVLSSIRFYKGENYKYIQLVYPDTSGYFPNDKQYNYDQVILGQYMTREERKLLSSEPIQWTGDLTDDCTAKWGGLMLRAESMNGDHWWWAVYDMQRDEITIDSSNEYNERFPGGEVSRKKAESVAIKYISIVTSSVIAKYSIADTFKLTGRGIVFAGYISEGTISAGDTIEFTAFGTLRQRRIIGIEGIRKSQPDRVNTGLLIECNNPHEIDELRNWKPEKIEAVIYRTSDE